MDAARFTRRREEFDCLHCGARVRGTGYTNHCPRCLWSRHVDVAPGDRAAECGGAMAPVGALAAGDGFVVVQRCERCGHVWRNRSAPGDDRDALLALTGRAVPDPPRPGPPRSDRPRPARSRQGPRPRRGR